MKDPYHCPYCHQRSTRRWNLQVHMKRKHGELPGTYLASHQLSYEPTNPYHDIESTTVAHSFQPRYGLQQAPVGISQYSRPIHPPRHVRDESSLSQEKILNIHELKALVNKYPQYQEANPDAIIRLAIYNSINGDNTLLDNKLDQLRTIDSLAKYYAS